MILSITGMNMPRCCADCDLLYDYMRCSVTGTRADFEKMDSERLPNCPLKEITDNTETAEQSEIWGDGFAAGLAVGAKWAERPKGKWILQSRTPGFFGRDDVDNFKCSVCGKITSHTYVGVVENEITPYCPQCGASMSKDIERMF